MSDYERIKSSCIERGELWEDPDFPATQTSVFYHQTPPFVFVWKRAKEIHPNSQFIDNSETFDVVPGKLGDKWLVSCLGVLYLSRWLFHRVVPADQRMDAPYAGVFRFRIWWCGEWVEVLVDDRLPTVNGKLAFLQTSHTEQLWPALLEKAYAKLHGSYEALKYGTVLDGLADLTGGITETLLISDIITDPTVLSQSLRTTSVVTAHLTPVILDEKLKSLDPDMNYRIYNVQKVQSSAGPVFLLRLGRPLPTEAMTVKQVIMDIGQWMRIPHNERDGLAASSTSFWMLYTDFVRLFTRLEMVHLDTETSQEELSLADKHQWQMKYYKGGWKRGVSAGGCRNFVHFFHTNPQVQIRLKETNTIVVSLNQHSIMEPKVIGFSIYKLPGFLTTTAEPQTFQNIRSIINSQYTNSRQVSQRCTLEAGAYLIMPTTFEPREEANFSLRVFSIKSLDMDVLDTRPQMLRAALIKAPHGLDSSSFSQYEGMFLQLADEHRTIDAFELQDLLDVCLPNDYIKSCASIDTCRQIVLSMGKNATGRISLSAFKDLLCSLKHWQLVFKSHAREKMGVLRAEILRDALREVGFVVPECAMSLLILRYMRKDGMLRFGDFVSVILHLHRAFFTFYAMGTTPRAENFDLNLSDWLRMVLLC